jgi:hypothetical protein
MAAKRKPGRPRLGAKPLTPAERVANYDAAARAAGKRRLSVWIDAAVLDALHEYAGEHGVSLAETVTRLTGKL